MKYKDSVIAVFAKTPMPGAVKTRLVPVLGEVGALRLHRALMSYTVNRVRDSRLAPFELWLSHPGPADDLVAQLAPEQLKLQAEGDLGARMLCASREILGRAAAVVIIGSDCPSIDGQYLEQALARLAGGDDLVLGPAEDGGYVLLGVSGIWPELFTGIAWGGPGVFAATLERVAGLDLRHSVLEPRWDVDRPEDLVRLDSLRPPLEFRLQAP